MFLSADIHTHNNILRNIISNMDSQPTVFHFVSGIHCVFVFVLFLHLAGTDLITSENCIS